MVVTFLPLVFVIGTILVVGASRVNEHPEIYLLPGLIAFGVLFITTVTVSIIASAQARKAKKQLEQYQPKTPEDEAKKKSNRMAKLVGAPIGLLLGFALIDILFSFVLVDDLPITLTLRPYAIVVLVLGILALIAFGVGGSMKAKADKEKAAQAAILKAQEDFEKVKAKTSHLPHPATFILIPNSSSVVWMDHKKLMFYFNYMSDAVEDVNLCMANEPWGVLYDDIVCYKSEGQVTMSQTIDPGTGGSVTDGMGSILGSMIGGTAGNLLAMTDNISTGKGPSIKTITKDDRHVVLIYRDPKGGLIKSSLPYGAEEILDKLIPDKSFIYLQSKSIETMSQGQGLGHTAVEVAAAMPVVQEILKDDSDEIEAKLVKLKTMLEKKLITQEEYDKKRADLLSKI